ncbi:hypothetical protein ACHQM5_017967 [Ranunculus cassubicifolius]
MAESCVSIMALGLNATCVGRSKAAPFSAVVPPPTRWITRRRLLITLETIIEEESTDFLVEDSRSYPSLPVQPYSSSSCFLEVQKAVSLYSQNSKCS